MTTFLIFNTTYTDLHIGIFQDSVLIDSSSIENKQTSKLLLGTLQELLQRHKKQLHNLDFLCAIQGPAPFTTLRVTLASVNGLAFATGLPLVGIDGIFTLAHQYADHADTILVIFEAFCNDVYYGIYNRATGKLEKGCISVPTFLAEKLQPMKGSVLCMGNKADSLKESLMQVLGPRALFLPQTPTTASLETIAVQALKHWHDKENIEAQLMPLYLKTQSAIINDSLHSSTSSL